MICLMQILLLLTLAYICWVLKCNNSREMIVPIYWVLFWFFISVLNPLSLNYYPQDSFPYIYISVFLFILGNLTQKKTMINNNEAVNELEDISLQKTALWISLIIGPIIIYFSVKAVSLITSMPLYAYRRTVYTEPELLMGIKQLFPMFQLFVEGGLLLLLMISFQQAFYNGKKKLIIVSFIFACIFSIIFLGRYSIYRLLVLSLLFSLSYSKDLKSLAKTILASLIIGLILVGFSIYRSNGLFGVNQVFIKHILGYHSFGFSLFEYYMQNSPDYLDRTWFGTSVFGSFSYFLTKPLDLISNTGSYLTSQDFIDQDIFINLGSYSFNTTSVELNANAFYMIFTDLFRDLSWFGVLIFYPLGKLATYLQDRVKLNDPIAMLGLMYLSFLIIFMIMKNPFVRHEVILPTLYISYKIYTTRRSFRYV